MTQQMHDTGLDLSVREDAIDSVWKSLQAINNGDQGVGDAPVTQLVRHAHPELRALGLLDPDPKDFLATIGSDPVGQVHYLAAYRSLIAHLGPNGVKKDERVQRLRRPTLPTTHFLEDAIVTVKISCGDASMPYRSRR